MLCGVNARENVLVLQACADAYDRAFHVDDQQLLFGHDHSEGGHRYLWHGDRRAGGTCSKQKARHHGL